MIRKKTTVARVLSNWRPPLPPRPLEPPSTPSLPDAPPERSFPEGADPAAARPLGSLGRGQAGWILSVCEEATASPLEPGELERRLLEMGFVEGEYVALLHEGPMGGDPIAVRIGRSTVALRRNEANAVFVVPAPKGAHRP